MAERVKNIRHTKNRFGKGEKWVCLKKEMDLQM